MPAPDAPQIGPAQRAILRSLEVDLVTEEVVGAMREAGVRPVLLKGPAVAQWLYDDKHPRPYVDSDLLVAPPQHGAAERVLSRLGFVKVLADADTPGWRRPAHNWRRESDLAEVDLHRTLAGAEVTPVELWNVLEGRLETLILGNLELEVLSPMPRALHLALHAAQHGARASRPLADLERSLELLPREVWTEAAALAAQLGALEAFATGLRLVPAGAALASELGLPTARSTELALLAETPPPAALSFEWIARETGLRPRVAILARRLVPTARFMRAWTPLARRGRLGLAAAYAWRPLWLLAKAGPGFAAWRRARRLG